ncbi:Uncharacterised protein [Serratia quinivorans]|uniref:hypothetical protein n=1 Tax=Serratia quinivorans TaxID=137545 RepID=UPI002177B5FD|nr:hypothetical protein [Serratia quinivorans]CAI1819959.1 Uncharacterised protein [Serratia quinivorans]
MDKLHEDSRKQFEKYFYDFYGCHPTDYHDQAWMEEKWHVWQASRSSIVVEPPKGLTTREALDLGYMGDYAAGVDDGIEETIKVIRSIGLSIKGEGV